MKYLEIAKSCGAEIFSSQLMETTISISEKNLKTYTEQVCKQIVEALEIISSGGKGKYQWSLTKAENLSKQALAAHKEMIGDLYE